MSLLEFEQNCRAVRDSLRNRKGSPDVEILDLTDENLASFDFRRGELVEQYVDPQKAKTGSARMPEPGGRGRLRTTPPAQEIGGGSTNSSPRDYALGGTWHSRRGKEDAYGRFSDRFPRW